MNRLFLKRNSYYRHFDKQATLFDDAGLDQSPSKQTFTVNKRIKVPIDKLDFRYGSIAFRYRIPENKTDLEFEMENDEVRPEFDVLKPYFSRVLKTKNVEAEIFAEFEEGLLVSQKANSADLENINREVIDSVKFRFIEKNILGKQYLSETNDKLIDLNRLQEGQTDRPYYDSEEQLLDDLLKNSDVKHYKHLRYLASAHDNASMKVRFVLNPFSFVFLLTGTEQYHVVMETLDTEEATYIWHIEKNTKSIPQNLKQVNNDLNIIRNRGRQFFLENQPLNFSRIIHDYSDERKGFIIWKDQLEERLM